MQMYLGSDWTRLNYIAETKHNMKMWTNQGWCQGTVSQQVSVNSKMLCTYGILSLKSSEDQLEFFYESDSDTEGWQPHVISYCKPLTSASHEHDERQSLHRICCKFVHKGLSPRQQRLTLAPNHGQLRATQWKYAMWSKSKKSLIVKGLQYSIITVSRTMPYVVWFWFCFVFS